MDQHPMGHKKRKPTTIATNMSELFQLDGVRGEPQGEAAVTEAFRSMPSQRRMQESKAWSCWAMELKMAIATALNWHVHEFEDASAQQPSPRPLNQVALEAWKQHFCLIICQREGIVRTVSPIRMHSRSQLTFQGRWCLERIRMGKDVVISW